MSDLLNSVVSITDEEFKTDDKPTKHYMVEWYKKNKEKHLQTMKEKSICSCGASVSYGNRKRHLQTPKHLKKVSENTI